MSEEFNDPKGGEEGFGGDGPNLRYDEFVGRIVQDPNAPPSVTLLSGYLGSASEEGHVRVYLDEELCRYVEIPEKAIRHTQELSPEQSPLGGSLIWIDRDAEVLHGAAGSERRKATFLEGQIAQDYMGGGFDHLSGGTTTQTRECVAPPPTSVGPSCGPSQLRPCIPQTLLPGCRTRTGIFCTRLGPGCGLTSFDPVCTVAGQHCQTAFPHQCQSVFSPCVTQNQSYCVASGFFGCNPIDFTIYEQPGVQQQFGQQLAFAGGGFGGGGFDPNGGVFQTGFNCPSVFDNCATRDSFCQTQNLTCPSRLVVCQSQFGDCITHFGCPSRVIRCQTIGINCPTGGGPRCLASRVAICPDTQAGCQVESAACGFDPGGQVFEGAAAIPPTLSRTCPTRVGCISRFIRCPTMGEPRCYVSAVVLCRDTRAGCQFESAACGVDPAGGFDPAGGLAQGFEAQAYARHTTRTPDCNMRTLACADEPTLTSSCKGTGTGFVGGGGGGFGAAGAIAPTVYCPSQLVSCPTRFNCPSRYTPCQSQLVRCPSALDACPTRLGCYETAACGESIACNPGGGFDPGGFGGGGFGGGF